MSYAIEPREMFGVIDATTRERDALVRTMAPVQPHLDEAAAGARGSASIVAELNRFGAEHQTLVTEIDARVDAVARGGAGAVTSYVLGDALMAEQYADASDVFAGGPDIPPPPLPFSYPRIVTGG